MGCHGQCGLRGAAVLLLSARFVDSGCFTECCRAMDARGLRLHLGRAGSCGNFDVRAGSAMAWAARCDLRRSFLCGESLSSGHCLLAQRICGVARELPATVAVSAGAEGG